MQLFISTDFTRDKETISVHEQRIIHQCGRVLRLKPGSQIQIQDETTRYTLCLTTINKTSLQGDILHQEQLQDSGPSTRMLIALPNRQDKLELIVQKLTEIGVDEIVFWPAQRSQMKFVGEKKLLRLLSIALEASEQSFRTHLPQISVLASRDEKFILGHQVAFFTPTQQTIAIGDMAFTLGIIGPEGGRTDQEITYFSQITQAVSLGQGILRMETAAIIGAWLIAQH